MLMRKVHSSSNIQAVGWDADVLEVEFKSGVQWRYRNVTSEKFDEMMASVSIGSYFAREIKAHPELHPPEKVHDPRLPCTCKLSDAWRCARAKGLTGVISCQCYCHRERFGGHSATG